MGIPKSIPITPTTPIKLTKMDYQELEHEFDRILSLPLWQRPIMLSELAKRLKIPLSSIRASFDSFWSLRLREENLKR